MYISYLLPIILIRKEGVEFDPFWEKTGEEGENLTLFIMRIPPFSFFKLSSPVYSPYGYNSMY